MDPKSKVEKKYDCMVIHSEVEPRMRLKQATSVLHQFGKLAQMPDLNSGTKKLQTGGESVDVVFISSRFPLEAITEFIKQAKALPCSQDAAFVLIMQAKDQGATTVAQNVMIGANGFLFEPYSVDGLIEITRLAASVKAERETSREKAAIGIIVSTVIEQINQLSYVASCKIDHGSAMKRVRETCATFKDLDPQKLEIYFECAIRAFEEAPVPTQPLKTKKYQGVSSRIRKKMEEKILAEIDKQAEASKANPS